MIDGVFLHATQPRPQKPCRRSPEPLLVSDLFHCPLPSVIAHAIEPVSALNAPLNRGSGGGIKGKAPLGTL